MFRKTFLVLYHSEIEDYDNVHVSQHALYYVSIEFGISCWHVRRIWNLGRFSIASGTIAVSGRNIKRGNYGVKKKNRLAIKQKLSLLRIRGQEESEFFQTLEMYRDQLCTIH